MKILFVYPRFIKYLETFSETLFAGADLLNRGYSYPPALAIPVLISITDDRHECVYVDENIEDIDYDTDADVIAVSFFTPQATNAFRICTEFRKRGKLVVIGGVHTTVCYEEAQQYADIICIGEGENSWLQILKDIENNNWKKVYRQTTPTDLENLPVPERSVVYKNTEKYNILLDYLELSRGCNVECDTCVVPQVSGKKLRFKKIEKIVNDVNSLQYPMCFITDDIIFMQHEQDEINYLIELFNEIGKTGYGKDHGFYISSTALYPPGKKLMAAMKYAGAKISYFTFGFEQLSNSVLIGGAKKHRKKLIDQVKLTQDEGLLFYAAFHLGFDDHTVAVKDSILEFCHEANIKMAQFCLRVPWPGTRMWFQLTEEGRIIHTDWQKYNGSNVVFTPKMMTAEELKNMTIDLWKEFSFQFHKLYELQRTAAVDNNSPITSNV